MSRDFTISARAKFDLNRKSATYLITAPRCCSFRVEVLDLSAVLTHLDSTWLFMLFVTVSFSMFCKSFYISFLFQFSPVIRNSLVETDSVVGVWVFIFPAI